MNKKALVGRGSIRVYRRDEHGKPSMYRGRIAINGKLVESYGATEGAAREKLQALVDQPQPRSGERKLGEIILAWLEVKQSRVRGRTFINYESQARSQWIPVLGDVLADELDAMHIQALVNEMERRCQPGTVRRSLANLRTVLNWAERRQLIPTNPLPRGEKLTSQVDLAVPTHSPVQKWSLDEAQRFLSATRGDRLNPLWTLAIHTGIRVPSEILGLRWSDVEAGQIWVRRGLHEDVRDHNGPLTLRGGRSLRTHWEVLDYTKTVAGYRAVPLSLEASNALERQREQQERERDQAVVWYPSNQIFTTESGTMIAPSNLRLSFRRAIQRAGVRRIKMYATRATFGTLMYRQTHDIQMVAKLLGQTQITTTFRHYIGVDDDPGAQAYLAQAISAAFGGSSVLELRP